MDALGKLLLVKCPTLFLLNLCNVRIIVLKRNGLQLVSAPVPFPALLLSHPPRVSWARLLLWPLASLEEPRAISPHSSNSCLVMMMLLMLVVVFFAHDNRVD